MEIKGSAVKTIPDYIRKFHPDKYSAWMESLPEQSRQIFRDTIMPSGWYSMRDAAIVPTEALGRIIFNDAAEGAWQCGRYSAEIALTGIYKFFIKAASPFFIVDRAGRIFSTFYQPSAMEVVERGTDYVVLHITRFDEPSTLIEARIAGWIEKAMEIHGIGTITVVINKSLTRGDPVTEIRVSWSYNPKQ
jgi:hypothetical protein